MDGLELSVVPATSDEARRALAQYFEELRRRFPGGFEPGDEPVEELVVARVGGEVVGCGAIALLDAETAEIKRMWVAPEHRGHGVARCLLAHLEREAARAGRSTVVLDTNGTLTEAIRLYESAGYVATERYSDNPYAERWFTKPVVTLTNAGETTTPVVH